MAKTAIITGGAKRIGREIGLCLAQNGWNIALCCNKSAKQADQTAAQIRNHKVECEVFCCDLADTNAAIAMLEEIFAKMPDVAALVNNASVFERSPIAQTTQKLFDRHMDINLKTPFFMLQAFAKHCCLEGCVINITDTRVVKNQNVYAAYLLSKKMLTELTRMAAIEYAPNIRVNAIAPGPVLEPDGIDREYITHLVRNTPLKNPATVEEITRSVMFLLECEHITGQVIFADSGQHLI